MYDGIKFLWVGILNLLAGILNIFFFIWDTSNWINGLLGGIAIMAGFILIIISYFIERKDLNFKKATIREICNKEI